MLIVGINDLATTKPELAAQWHPTKNGDLTPKDVTAGSNKKVWWQCTKGHEWQAVVYSRSQGTGCPFCSGLLPIVSVTDLAKINPELAAEWHPTLNGDLTPKDVTAGSGKKVWWMCDKGHEWKAAINNRSKGSRCPYCLGLLPIVGETDLATTNPELAAEWHPTKNGVLTPKGVTAGSGKKVWWKCSMGHEWQTAICQRKHGTGCPVCGRKIAGSKLTERNVLISGSLQQKRPNLAAEWHPTKNGDLTPRDVTAGSSKKVWWMCDQGHEWQAVIKIRSRGTGCPVCSRLKQRENRRKNKDS